MKNRQINRLKALAEKVATSPTQRRRIFRELKKAHASSRQFGKQKEYLLQGVCRCCGQPRDPDSVIYCLVHKEKARGYNRVAQQTWKAKKVDLR